MKRFRRQKLPRQHHRNKQKTYGFLLRKKKEKTPSHALELRGKNKLSFLWKKYQNLFFGGILGGVVFIVFGSIFFFSNLFVIRQVELTRRDFRVDVVGISRVIESFQGSNIFLVSERNVREEIQTLFPEVSAVELDKDYPDTIRVIVETFPIAARWNFELLPEEIPEPQDEDAEVVTEREVFLNTVGKMSVVGAEEDTSQHLLIREKVPVLPAPTLTSAQVVSAAMLDEILTAKNRLEETVPFPISSVEFFRDAREVHFIAENGPTFWLDFFAPLEEQIRKIELARQEVNVFETDLEYLDLRIPGKLIYKPANG